MAAESIILGHNTWIHLMSHFHRNKTAASQNYMKNEHLVDKIYLALKSSVKEYKTMNSPIKRTFYFWNSFIIIKEKITYRKLFIISFSFSCDGCRSFATAIGISNININMTWCKNKTETSCYRPLQTDWWLSKYQIIFRSLQNLSFGKKSQKTPVCTIFFSCRSSHISVFIYLLPLFPASASVHNFVLFLWTPHLHVYVVNGWPLV